LPRCEFDPADYTIDHHNPLVGRLSIRGVPAHLYEGGLRLEVYTGMSTVVIFGVDQAQVKRAARALVRASDIPTGPVQSGDTSLDLPQPPARRPDCNDARPG
jgi:hypothetical protein